MKKEITIGICFVMAGILCACFFGYEYFTTYGFLNEYHMRSFADTDTELMTLLGNILWERGKLFVFLWILSYTPAHKVIPLVLRCLICFTGGIFLAACMLNMGIAGFMFFRKWTCDRVCVWVCCGGNSGSVADAKSDFVNILNETSCFGTCHDPHMEICFCYLRK